MSLDKWIKPEKKKEPPKKPKPEIKKEEIEPKKDNPKIKLDKDLELPVKKEAKKERQEPTFKITKFLLTCPKKSCNYQRTLVKKELSEKDQICRKCRGKMKVKEV